MAKDIKKNTFISYDEHWQFFSLLPIEQRGFLVTAIYEYRLKGETTQPLSEAAYMAYHVITSQIARDTARYLDVCKKNAMNGKLGGRPPKNRTKAKKANGYEKTERKRTKAKKPHNDNDSDSDNDNDNDITPPISPSKEGENNNNNDVSPPISPSAEGKNNKEDISFEIIKFFNKHQFISNVEDFIAYNTARDWKGLGGEDIRADFERYAWKWETEEHHRQGDTYWRPPWDL